MVWSSPAIPILKSNDTTINPLPGSVSNYDISLIVASFGIGNILPPLFIGKIMDHCGRKNSLLFLSLLCTTSMILLAYSTKMLFILLARTMNGVVLGAAMTALPIFVAEITQDHSRGKFGCFMNLFMPLGQLFGYTMGLFFSLKYFTLACAVPTALSSLLLFFFIPDTPLYLLYKGNTKAASRSLERYRTYYTSSEIERDLILLEFAVKESAKEHNGNWKSIFTFKPARRGFLIGLGLVMVQMSSGITALVQFMGPIFEEAKAPLSGNLIAVLVGLLKISIFFTVAHIIEKSGKKPLMLMSSTFSCIFLFILGLYFFVKERRIESYENYSWVAVASIMSFIVMYSFGLGPIPFATIGELFATNIRSTGVTIITFLINLYCTILVAAYPLMVEYIGISGCMWIFSGSCALGALFCFYFMPETKGKSLYEIQEILKGDWNTRKVINIECVQNFTNKI